MVRHCPEEDTVPAQAVLFQFVDFQPSFLHLPIEGDDSVFCEQSFRAADPTLNMLFAVRPNPLQCEVSPPKSANLDPAIEKSTDLKPTQIVQVVQSCPAFVDSQPSFL